MRKIIPVLYKSGGGGPHALSHFLLNYIWIVFWKWKEDTWCERFIQFWCDIVFETLIFIQKRLKEWESRYVFLYIYTMELLSVPHPCPVFSNKCHLSILALLQTQSVKRTLIFAKLHYLHKIPYTALLAVANVCLTTNPSYTANPLDFLLPSLTYGTDA